jgi:hypothetical protein
LSFSNAAITGFMTGVEKVNTFMVSVPLSPLLVFTDAPEALAPTAERLPTSRQVPTAAVMFLPSRDERAGRRLRAPLPPSPPALGIVI